MRVGRVLMLVLSVVVPAGVVAARGPGAATVEERPVRLDRAPRTFSVVAVGDWLSENRFNDAAVAAAPPGVRIDHVPLLAPVAPIIASASLAICHMELPITGPGGPFGYIARSETGTSLLAAPYEAAGDLRRTGFDRCSTASNHAWDLGAPGIVSTLAALDQAGISHTGTARSPAEVTPPVFDVAGVRVAHLSFALNSNTGYPGESWWFNHVTDPDQVVRAVDAAREAGAEVVIVSLHVYVEMQAAPAPADRALVEAITSRSSVDLFVITGPHTIQPLETVNGAAVFWSLGNFVSAMGTPTRGRYADPRTLDGLAAAVRFTERSDGTFALVAAPVLLCQMVGSRIVYPGFAPSGVPIPAAELDDIDACRTRSMPIVDGLR